MLAYINGGLHFEGLPLTALTAQYGSPLYVYSLDRVRANYRRLAAAFAPLQPLVCYAVKANGNLALLRALNAAGAGFDIVSGGELHRVLRAGADPAHVVFAGVGKTEAELAAGLQAGVGWFNVESADELQRLSALATRLGRTARVALRLNPSVEPDTHHHIRTGGAHSKFGLPVAEARALLAAPPLPGLEVRGLHLHIGSQMADPGPTRQAVAVALALIAAAPQIDTLDLGGGFPVAYRDDAPVPPVEAFAASILEAVQPYRDRLRFHLEPGRALVADAGVLMAEVQAVKHMGGRRVIVTDTGMHHLLRPALYQAYHRIWPVREAPALPEPAEVVGPICESADVLGQARLLPALRPGDQLALLDTGAYGFSMASNYNAQPRPAEVVVEGGAARLARRRETYADLVALED